MSISDAFEKKQYLAKLKVFETDTINFDMDERTGARKKIKDLEKALENLKEELMKVREHKMIAMTRYTLAEFNDEFAKAIIQQMLIELVASATSQTNEALEHWPDKVNSLAHALKAYCDNERFEGGVDYQKFCREIIEFGESQ